MKLMNNIKAYVGRRVLSKHLSSHTRKPVVCNINNAGHIGIIYNATESVSFEIIRDLVKDLSHDKRKVTVLGYVDSKKLIDNYLYRKGFDFFSKNELNWYSKPVSSTTDEFIKEPFDLLINLSLEDHYPIQYITALSPAAFKAGKFSPDDQILDFMIDIEKEKNTMRNLQKEIKLESGKKKNNAEIEADIEKKTETELQLSFLINQLLHYLSIIKN
ncbi:MAG: hypothetical protein JXA72_05460 [Bacteroidales bacterium]|nr:hypothetical protein [Bacteroidales bacterium]